VLAVLSCGAAENDGNVSKISSVVMNDATVIIKKEL
jgi:hypothetical protein